MWFSLLVQEGLGVIPITCLPLMWWLWWAAGARNCFIVACGLPGNVARFYNNLKSRRFLQTVGVMFAIADDPSWNSSNGLAGDSVCMGRTELLHHKPSVSSRVAPNFNSVQTSAETQQIAFDIEKGFANPEVEKYLPTMPKTESLTRWPPSISLQFFPP